MKHEAFEKKKKRLLSAFTEAAKHGTIGLKKKTSNLFRKRDNRKNVIDVTDFVDVLHIDEKNLIGEVEGMIPFADFVDATLEYGLLPAVVPELKSITVGGAVSGGGIESSSFLYGLVHENILEMEVLTGDGKTVVCSPTENSDLYYGFPSTYGSLGYSLRLKMQLYEAGTYVKLVHTKYIDVKKFFSALQKVCDTKGLAFVDGVVFGEKELYLVTGEFVDEAPFVSDYTYMDVYYKSIRERKVDYLTARDYIWRWDTDWFWCSKHIGMQNKVLRALAGRRFLNSVTYQKIMRLNQRFGITKLFGESKKESVIQDVEIPIENAAKFLSFFHQKIGILPIWICPTRQRDKKAHFSIYPFTPGKIYVNFGFWDTIETSKEEGYYNKLIEREVEKLGGNKSLYSDSYYSKKKFWQLYNKKAYDKLKKKYDPNGRFRNLYEKCVRRR